MSIREMRTTMSSRTIRTNQNTTTSLFTQKTGKIGTRKSCSKRGMSFVNT